MRRRLVAATIAIAAGVTAAGGSARALTAVPMGPVNVRSGPGLDFAVIALLRDGQTAQILGHEGDWLKVRTPGGSVGYMADWVTRKVYDDAEVYIQVATDVLNVRQGPGLDYTVVGQILQDEQYRALEAVGGWYKIDARELGIGWVSADWVQEVVAPAPPPPEAPPEQDVPPSPGPEPPAPDDAAAPDPEPPAPDGAPAQPPAAQGVMAHITADVAIHARPTRDSLPLGAAEAGEELPFVEARDGWVKVTTALGIQGWVPGSAAALEDRRGGFVARVRYAVEADGWTIRYPRIREVTPDGGGLRLRQQPSTAAPIVRTLQPGQRMELLGGEEGEFVQVRMESGEEGWVSRRWLKPVPGAPEGAVHLTHTGEGALRLEVADLPGVGAPTLQGQTLRIPLPARPLRSAALEVERFGVRRIAMDARSLTVQLQEPMGYQVAERRPDRLVLNLGLDLETPAEPPSEPAPEPEDPITIRLLRAVDVPPVLKREADALSFYLPGAVLAEGEEPPEGVTLRQTPFGVKGQTSADRTVAVQRRDGQAALVIFRSGLAGRRIILDPGHGGFDPGAVGVTGLTEKEVNLDIALRLQALLEQAGATVRLTRSADTPCGTPEEWAAVSAGQRVRFDLNCRAQLTGRAEADLFLSIHNNASPSRLEGGTETYWSALNPHAAQSRRLAAIVQQELVAALGLRNRGVKEERFYVIKHAQVPAALAEIAFMSHAEQEALLRDPDFRQRAAEALLRALERYFQEGAHPSTI